MFLTHQKCSVYNRLTQEQFKLAILCSISTLIISADSMSRGDFAELIFADMKYKRLETGLRNWCSLTFL